MRWTRAASPMEVRVDVGWAEDHRSLHAWDRNLARRGQATGQSPRRVEPVSRSVARYVVRVPAFAIEAALSHAGNVAPEWLEERLFVEHLVALAVGDVRGVASST